MYYMYMLYRKRLNEKEKCRILQQSLYFSQDRPLDVHPQLQEGGGGGLHGGGEGLKDLRHLPSRYLTFFYTNK